MKYSFLFPYKNRADQLWNTLLSLLHWYGGRTDWEVIVIVDGDEALTLPAGMDGRVKAEAVHRKDVNPAPLFNKAARLASGEFLVISNPECFHVTDVLGWFDRVFTETPGGYAVAACDCVKRVGRLESYREEWQVTAIYQHSTEWNVWYHWCSAMHRDTYWKLGGFDEAFGPGYAGEDDDFRDRVVCAGIKIVTDDAVKVLHQEHDKLPRTPDLMRRHQMNIKRLRMLEKRRGYKHDVFKFKGAK